MSSNGVTLSFGPSSEGFCLHLNGRSPEIIELRLDRKTRLWRLPDVTALPDGFYRLARVEKPRHPDEACEIFVKDKHDSAALKLKWEGVLPYPWADGARPTEDAPGKVKGEPSKPNPEDGTFEKATAGVVWLRHRGGRFPIGIFPRNLNDDTKLEDPQVAIPKAMNRIWNMVSELSEDALTEQHWMAQPRANAKEKQNVAAPGVGIGSGGSHRPRVYQELTRLEGLLWGDGGVVAAWQALMADPVVRLETEYPVRPAYLARRPIYAGNRGPWTLPDGWSPYREDGLVRDRRVVRSGDTPPNRLAVGLARRVMEVLRRLQATLPMSQWYGYEWLGSRIRHAAEEVLAAPAFAEVRRDAPVPLESPSLQLNSRCRPLLEAWATLDRGLSTPSDLPIDEVMLQPIAQTELLYELWCFLGICAALRAQGWGADGTEPGKDFVAARFSRGGQEVAVYASQRKNVRLDFVRSWSPAGRPDGLIVVRRADEVSVVVWDAKYQPWVDSPNSREPHYQAHAFRDAIRVKDPPLVSTNGKFLQPTWSLACYPVSERNDKVGKNPTFYPYSDVGDKAEVPPKRAVPGTAGVGMLPLAPSEVRTPQSHKKRGLMPVLPNTSPFSAVGEFLAAYLPR